MLPDLEKDHYTTAVAIKERTEHQLVRALRAQEESAWRNLYEAYAPALYGVILRIVKGEALAEEILQECFLKIWQSFGQYDPARGKLFTWLINIARHLAIDKIRSRSYLEDLRTQKIETSHWPVGYPGFQPEHMGLRKLVDQLAPSQRIVIDLMYFEGYTQSEIAQELAIPLGTVKTRARSALQLLRKLM
ncbi:RNA polymerase sigma factor [Adhaeribacter pallidiroseus]|uniref:RNA polymerase sigma factor n=1 Tax=Adhaeribacter pallidiroseus TaxID=2072847 RepID=UPI000E1BF75F|nr:sigma-70 family RNA polymerase sigma factor [Adhaeribacter pallidiroseus]